MTYKIIPSEYSILGAISDVPFKTSNITHNCKIQNFLMSRFKLTSRVEEQSLATEYRSTQVAMVEACPWRGLEIGKVMVDGRRHDG